jgi:hypothetical protein
MSLGEGKPVRWTRAVNGDLTANGPSETTGIIWRSDDGDFVWCVSSGDEMSDVDEGVAESIGEAKAQAEAAMFRGYGMIPVAPLPSQLRPIVVQMGRSRREAARSQSGLRAWKANFEALETALTDLTRRDIPHSSGFGFDQTRSGGYYLDHHPLDLDHPHDPGTGLEFR